jgi:hypothetical protein
MLIRKTIFDEFMMFSRFSASGTLGKTKPPTHQGGGFQSSGGDFIW